MSLSARRLQTPKLVTHQYAWYLRRSVQLLFRKCFSEKMADGGFDSRRLHHSDQAAASCDYKGLRLFYWPTCRYLSTRRGVSGWPPPRFEKPFDLVSSRLGFHCNIIASMPQKRKPRVRGTLAQGE